METSSDIYHKILRTKGKYNMQSNTRSMECIRMLILSMVKKSCILWTKNLQFTATWFCRADSSRFMHHLLLWDTIIYSLLLPY